MIGWLVRETKLQKLDEDEGGLVASLSFRRLVDGNVLELTFRRVIPSKNHHLTSDLDSRGVGRDDHDRLLSVRVGVVGIALAHDEVKLASRISRS